MALNFTQFANEANSFLKNYTQEMSLANDTDKAGRILSSILHALRDVISTEESLNLISQFPMFLKAVYVNGWTMKKKEKILSAAKEKLENIILFKKPKGTVH